MSIRNYLEKYKRQGRIDFIKVPLDWGKSYNEFIIFSLEHKKFSRVFFDNKYREETFTPDIKQWKGELEELAKGLNDFGIYSTRQEYAEKKAEVDFIEKYTNN